jgi:uncharacterized protein YbjT (DUF2867 family)
MPMSLVAVFGASGRQGLAQVRQLSRAGHHVRALSRSADPFYGERFDNTHILPADIMDEPSLQRAFDGVDAVFYTHPLRGPTRGEARDRSDRVGALDRLGRVAKAAGVKRFVWNTSSWIPDRPGDPGFYASNTDGVNALWRSGVPATVFGSVLFMDNLLTNWAFPYIVRDGTFIYAHKPDLEANWISLDDVAKIMIASLDRADMEGAWMNIGGPERLKPTDIAEALSGPVGRKVRYEPVSPRKFGELLTGAFGDDMEADERKATEDYIDAFYQYNNTAPTRPFQVDTATMLERMPIKLETIREWAARQDWSLSNKPRPPAG